MATAKFYENGLPDNYYVYLTTGGTGLNHGDVDTRVPNATILPSGPFQLTSKTHPYDAYENSPVHRFYQMWQQFDCSVSNATKQNPSGCLGDLFPWVEVTVGAGSNGLARPAGFNDTSTTKEGSTSMGFYNVQQGDAPYFKYLADHYAMSDNFHQSVMGGTGAGGSFGSPSYGGGSYTNCSDSTQPGVAPITNYLSSLNKPINPGCDQNHFYLLNDYNPGYYGDGRSAYADIGNPKETVFTIPPSPLRDIGDELNEKNISWAYYGDPRSAYLANPDGNYVTPDNTYCNICNPLQYSTSIMTNPSSRANLQDTTVLYQAIRNGKLPAISYVKPDGWLDGHPASSELNLFEGFVKKIVDGVQANEDLWESTAIIVTFDEGGGYYDSGYIQPLDYFGDGTRIPTLLISPHTKPGHISHTYTDHASILKFIEANWRLAPVTARSRDNFPNPVASKSNPYVPLNSPAIGDLMDLFTFGEHED